jgi:hypothetical protein
MPPVRRRRASGNLAQLKVEVWATICFLGDTVADTEVSLEARLKAAAGMCISAGVFRNILQDCREEKTREAIAALAIHDAKQRLALREAACDLDDQDPLDVEVDEEPALPDGWEEAVHQAARRGTLGALEQSRVLGGLPPPNKALVQAMVLADIGTAKPSVGREYPEVPPPRVPRPVPPTPDPEELRLAALEAEVRGLVDAVKSQVRATAAPG